MESGVPGTPIKRRLTAILAADAVGYSRQMSENEERTLQVLAAQRAIIDRIIAAHGGRIVGTAGDSVLAEFPSSVEAVRCAVEVQEGLETRNAGLPEQERLVFRIGVNLGDVMVDGADILGDGVNVAARLEGIADPGGICISSSVYDQIAGKLNLGFVDIGEKSLKNISRPIRVYRFDRSGEFLATPRRPRSRSRTMWIGASAAAVLAIAAVATWRSGVFEARPAPVPMASTAAGPPTAATPAAAPSPSSPPTAAPAAAAPTPEAASEETKLKLRIAEAERAKAEAELARSRAEAEAAKQRARSERKESAPAPAPASAASVPPATPGATASGAPASATPATAAAKPEAPVVVAVSKASGSGGADVPPALAANGKGTASRFCDAWEDAKAFNDVLPARVVDGEVIVERGLPGQPGFVKMTGKPTGDGRLTLLGSFVSTLARVGGREHLLRFDGTYGNGQYSLNGRLGARSCTVIVRLDAH